ncbi:imidazole glycerol phosphate synthase subunit hisF [Magnetococcus marinus MC-1]|uniref:imidazole glycerol-phosphate synthase n=1 Tax=Magnetococcus marinus (strain ATCC BAA-1437 / JCM 17883 / MC-1) TaxID=156889 RepID=A0LAC8_MAGMM|nr:AglZ/HisF2 family acetamidino modification protein [Magnetococcus marinus]ABK44921.1 imidazole glycerol phosphate synthase subunit hisF [Magnetococcus marinus MC-1]
MRRIRVIPTLLLKEGRLVKTVRFNQAKATYVGDPVNTAKIFNDKEVDELAVLDISASRRGAEPDFECVEQLASECFMPLLYGGGVRNLQQIQRLFHSGVEKVMLNTAFFSGSGLLQEAVKIYGSQSLGVSIDVKKDLWGRYRVMSQGGQRKTGLDPVVAAQQAEQAGAGELLLNAMDQDGMQQGYDLELVQRVSRGVAIPVIAVGGAASVADFRTVVTQAGAAAVAAGSMFVFRGPHRAVLVNYPNQEQLQNELFQHLES